MKTSEVQMTEKELATLQGLAGLGQTAAQRKLDTMQTPAFQSGAALQVLQSNNPVIASLAANKQSAQQQQDKPLADKLMEYVKNPYVIGGVALVLATVGFLMWKRSKRATAQVAAVETLGLEGIKPKRKKRRSKRKSKK